MIANYAKVATRLKSQAPATQSTSRIPRKSQMQLKVQHMPSRSSSDSARSSHTHKDQAGRE